MASRDELANNFLNSDAVGDDFFIGIVENKLNIKRDDFKLRLVLLSPATGKNENYVAVLYRAKIKIEILSTKEKKSIDVIIKALLSTMPELKEFGVFPRERFVYENVLRSFEDIWLERAGEEIKFGPGSIKFETDPYEQIILDDLKAEGFQMLDRKVGSNLEQTKMVLAKLAKFHAASSIRYQTDGIIQNYFDRKSMFPPNMKMEDSPFYAGFKTLFHAFERNIRGYGDCDVYADKISQWKFEKIFTLFMDVAVPTRGGFQVLNHGDMWLNNMMFRSDEAGNPLEVSLIDYQGSFWASPSNDLLYFLISSVADDVKIEYFDEFVAFYHGELTKALKKLKYGEKNVPTLGELHIDMLEKGAFGCSCLMFILFIVKYDSTEEITVEQMMTGTCEPEMFDRIYNNEIYKKAVKLWLQFFNKRGFLDILIEDNGEE